MYDVCSNMQTHSIFNISNIDPVCHFVELSCRAIKQIASGFNLTNELTVSLNGLVLEAKQLKSAQARESADRAIEELKAFVSQLSEEASGAAHMFGLVDCLCRQKISSGCRSASADSNNAKACPFITL